MRILLTVVAVGAVTYEIVAWITRNRRRDMLDGLWWLQREWRKGARWDGHEDQR